MQHTLHDLPSRTVHNFNGGVDEQNSDFIARVEDEVADETGGLCAREESIIGDAGNIGIVTPVEEGMIGKAKAGSSASSLKFDAHARCGGRDFKDCMMRLKQNGEVGMRACVGM
jgi:hypothetical protein